MKVNLNTHFSFKARNNKQKEKRGVSHKMMPYIGAAMLSLSTACCSSGNDTVISTSDTNWSELNKLKVYQQINKKELLKGFAADYIQNVEMIADNTYKMTFGFNTVNNFCTRGDILGEAVIIKNPENPNLLRGNISIKDVGVYIYRTEEPNGFGGTRGIGHRVPYTTSRMNKNFEAELVKDSNGADYQIYLKIYDRNDSKSETKGTHTSDYESVSVSIDGDNIKINGEDFTREQIEKLNKEIEENKDIFTEHIITNKNGEIDLDGEEPFAEVERMHRIKKYSYLTIVIGVLCFLGICAGAQIYENKIKMNKSDKS